MHNLPGLGQISWRALVADQSLTRRKSIVCIFHLDSLRPTQPRIRKVWCVVLPSFSQAESPHAQLITM